MVMSRPSKKDDSVSVQAGGGEKDGGEGGNKDKTHHCLCDRFAAEKANLRADM